LGGGRHHEQTFRLDSASAALAVLGTLAMLTLVLPNYVDPSGQREFTPVQLIVIDVVVWRCISSSSLCKRFAIATTFSNLQMPAAPTSRRHRTP
jgi:hypothetical protein